MLGIDFLNSGPGAVPPGITGLVVGHLWWWGVWGGITGSERDVGRIARYVRAPAFVRRLFGEERVRRDTEGGNSRGGVRVIPPRREESSEHAWGKGYRLGG